MKSKGLDTTVDAMLRRAKINLNGGQAPGAPKMLLPRLGGKLNFGGGVSPAPVITFRPKTPKVPKVPEVKAAKYPFLRKR